jgi:hypothetical protein
MVISFPAGGIAAKLDGFLWAPLQAGKALFAAMLPYGPPVWFAGIVNHLDIVNGANPGANPAPVAVLIGVKRPIHQLAAFQERQIGPLIHASDLEPGRFSQGLVQMEGIRQTREYVGGDFECA